MSLAQSSSLVATFLHIVENLNQTQSVMEIRSKKSVRFVVSKIEARLPKQGLQREKIILGTVPVSPMPIPSTFLCLIPNETFQVLIKRLHLCLRPKECNGSLVQHIADPPTALIERIEMAVIQPSVARCTRPDRRSKQRFTCFGPSLIGLQRNRNHMIFRVGRFTAIDATKPIAEPEMRDCGIQRQILPKTGQNVNRQNAAL